MTSHLKYTKEKQSWLCGHLAYRYGMLLLPQTHASLELPALLPQGREDVFVTREVSKGLREYFLPQKHSFTWGISV